VANGVTANAIDNEGIKWNFRTTPSGGSLYPTELYFLSFNVKGIESGMYFYNPLNNSAIKLEEYSPSNLRNKICEGVPNLKSTVDGSSLCIILASFMPSVSL
jgi:SagB-type dehydrogenase family enzyme